MTDDGKHCFYSHFPILGFVSQRLRGQGIDTANDKACTFPTPSPTQRTGFWGPLGVENSNNRKMNLTKTLGELLNILEPQFFPAVKRGM